MNDIGKREHVINHSQRRCVVGAFDKSLHKVYIWTVTGAVYPLSSINQYISNFYITVRNFMTNIENMMTEINILMMMGVVFFQNKMLDSFIMQNI